MAKSIQVLRQVYSRLNNIDIRKTRREEEIQLKRRRNQLVELKEFLRQVINKGNKEIGIKQVKEELEKLPDRFCQNNRIRLKEGSMSNFSIE